MLFVDRKVLDQMTRETRFTENEIKNMKNLYLSFAQIGKGLNYNRFEKFLSHIFNLDKHPFAIEIFLFFDRNKDNLVEFKELIYGLDMIERGNFDQKCQYCFSMYDIYDKGVLDIYTIREILKRSYSGMIITLEESIKKI
mmetsp:Transcript_32799/g.23719  ORF Transcript_32799/g.23719 Transcript_32799/m.23719 type:complete len:140 (-) Transcript_32799:1259-1678(-)